jgi:hypothetical protein
MLKKRYSMPGGRMDRYHQPASRLRQYNHDYLMQYPQ